MAIQTALNLFAAFAATTGAGGEPTNDDAGIISLVGLATVFSGLVLLCLFMKGLSWLLGERGGHTPDPVATADPQGGGAAEATPTGAAPSDRAPAESTPAAPAEVAPEWEPQDNQCLVPMTLLASAVMAYHMYERGELVLGKKSAFHLDGRDRSVTLLSAGYCNRALVDGEEVVFNVSEVAGNDSVGRRIVPAD